MCSRVNCGLSLNIIINLCVCTAVIVTFRVTLIKITMTAQLATNVATKTVTKAKIAKRGKTKRLK